LVEATLASLSGVLATHPTTIDVPPELPPVAVDPRLIERALVNVVGNVAKHTPAETLIAISGRVAGDMLEIRIEDSGPGLPEGSESQVFETFQRGENPGARKGAGLGLAIARAVMEAHGGSIRAERRDEGGARFVLALPMRK